jgi:GNAT superfamily N-acetyltransferase
MSDPELLRAYDTEVRARPRALPGFAIEHSGGVVLLTGAFNFVSHWDLSGRLPEEVVRKLATRFRRRREGLIWDIHGHDVPITLNAILESNGLRENQTTTLMALDLALFSDQPFEFNVQRVTDLSGLRDFVHVAGEAFGHQDDWVFDAYRDRLDSHEDQLFVTYVNERPAGSSRIELLRDTPFAALYGGGVAPIYRGRGIYRAMIMARAALAKARGVRYLTTTARETSRPILEHLGFRALTQVRRWVLPT